MNERQNKAPQGYGVKITGTIKYLTIFMVS